MKIGIFGDSFAAAESAKYPILLDYRPWSRILEEDYGYSIINFAKSATSLYWSYLQWEKNRNDFDKIIFVATGPGRLFIPQDPKGQHWTIQGINVEKNKTRDSYEAVKLFYSNIINWNEHELYKTLIMKEIASYENTLVVDNVKYIAPIAKKEFEYLKEFHPNIKMENENRYCHMTEENNNFVAEKMDEWLRTTKINLEDFLNHPLPINAVNKIDMYFPELTKG